MQIILISALVFVGAGVGTLTGFGTSTVLIPALAIVYPVRDVLLFVGIIHLCSDIWKLLLFRRGIKWKLLVAFGIPGIIASVLASMIVFAVDQEFLQRLLGVFILGYVVFLIFRPGFKLPTSMMTATVGGTASGLMAGLFGIGGAVRSMALSVFDLPKAVYLATIGAIALVIDVSRLTGYISQGQRLEQRLLLGMVIFIPISFVGAAAAKRVVDRVPQKHFRTLVAVFLLVAGLKLLFL